MYEYISWLITKLSEYEIKDEDKKECVSKFVKYFIMDKIIADCQLDSNLIKIIKHEIYLNQNIIESFNSIIDKNGFENEIATQFNEIILTCLENMYDNYDFIPTLLNNIISLNTIWNKEFQHSKLKLTNDTIHELVYKYLIDNIKKLFSEIYEDSTDSIIKIHSVLKQMIDVYIVFCKPNLLHDLIKNIYPYWMKIIDQDINKKSWSESITYHKKHTQLIEKFIEKIGNIDKSNLDRFRLNKLENKYFEENIELIKLVKNTPIQSFSLICKDWDSDEYKRDYIKRLIKLYINIKLNPILSNKHNEENLEYLMICRKELSEIENHIYWISSLDTFINDLSYSTYQKKEDNNILIDSVNLLKDVTISTLKNPVKSINSLIGNYKNKG